MQVASQFLVFRTGALLFEKGLPAIDMRFESFILVWFCEIPIF
jgi:hypothetical protein